MENQQDFDSAFDAGLSETAAMGRKYQRQDIINLCKAKSDKNKKYPATLGRALFVPVLDNRFRSIHHLKDVLELSIPVYNDKFDPNNPESGPEYYFTTIPYIAPENYTVPLTPSEKESLEKLKDLMYEYNDSFGKYDLAPKNIFFMKAILRKVVSELEGTIYDNTFKEPIVIRHTSKAFPAGFNSMCKTNDETRGKEWRRECFLQKGVVKNIVSCTTTKKDVGYNVVFEYLPSVNTGLSITDEQLKDWMDFDVDDLGWTTREFDKAQVDTWCNQINSAFDITEERADNDLSEGISSPQANESLADMEAIPPQQPTGTIDL